MVNIKRYPDPENDIFSEIIERVKLRNMGEKELKRELRDTISDLGAE